MTAQDVNIGNFKVSLRLDDDGHLSIFTESTDGSKPIDITDEAAGGENEVFVRISTEKIEAAANA